MNRTLSIVILAAACVLMCVTAVFAQDEEATEYMGAFSVLTQVIETIGFSVVYLAFYSAALLITLSYLKLYHGWDNDYITWIALLWVGGIAINAFSYKLTEYNRLYAVSLSLPMLFGWGLLINTRNFSDLLFKDALKVALVVALLCTPWFPIWRVEKPQKVDFDQVFNYQQPPNPNTNIPCLVNMQPEKSFFAQG